MYYTGIDQHKRTSYLTTVDNKGVILKQANVKNTSHDILNYFNQFDGKHLATVETRQKSTPKDGNKYLKIVFSDASVHAVHYYPVIRKFYESKLRKKNKMVAKTIVSKEIARIVYYVLKNKTNFNNHFKGVELQHKKSLQWPRVTNPDV